MARVSARMWYLSFSFWLISLKSTGFTDKLKAGKVKLILSWKGSEFPRILWKSPPEKWELSSPLAGVPLQPDQGLPKEGRCRPKNGHRPDASAGLLVYWLNQPSLYTVFIFLWHMSRVIQLVMFLTFHSVKCYLMTRHMTKCIWDHRQCSFLSFLLDFSEWDVLLVMI